MPRHEPGGPQNAPAVATAAQPILRALAEAAETARGHKRAIWEFALGIDALRDLGANDHHLRDLICQGLIEHKLEEHRPKSRSRVFRATANLGFGARSSFAITKNGEAVARESSARATRKKSSVKSAYRAVADPTSLDGLVPTWDPVRRQLKLGEIVLKTFRRPAPDEIALVEGFQQEKWRRWIDDPLQHRPPQDPQERLSRTVHNLNRRINPPLLQFLSDAKRSKVGWRLRDALLAKKAAKPAR